MSFIVISSIYLFCTNLFLRKLFHLTLAFTYKLFFLYAKINSNFPIWQPYLLKLSLSTTRVYYFVICSAFIVSNTICQHGMFLYMALVSDYRCMCMYFTKHFPKLAHVFRIFKTVFISLNFSFQGPEWFRDILRCISSRICCWMFHLET